MIKIGMVIGDRYEILESIGAGGMSDVYKAKDRKLNRFVALKVLKKEFSENKDFVSKFRTEAQAAAGLEHQNIVNVYDVGEEDGIYYIVMELVEGITLKRYIEKKQRLSVKESVSIAIQISMGLEAAHNNGIVHRDIKPQNIMISKDGKVKVTDFGIAKATSSNTITSNVMGSVHYASPEQARGGFSDAKSDIYSLGITLFEMLTGRVPFNGETAVAIAIMQIQNEMPSPRKYVPEIPVSVEQIVLKCCQKSPDRRYQKMSELVEDLKKSLISPDEDFVKIDSIESNRNQNALSGLPGSNVITSQLIEKVQSGKDFAMMYIDLDNFKEYNEYYGFYKGDKVILFLMKTLYDVMGECGIENDFVGHVGGDDFIMIVQNPDIVKEVGKRIISHFDKGIKSYYKEQDLKKGYIDARNRKGEIERINIMSISIIVVYADEFRTTQQGEMYKKIMLYKKQAKMVKGSVCYEANTFESSSL